LILDESALTFRASNLFEKISSKSSKDCDRGWERGQTNRQTDGRERREEANDFIICPMLCCSNGTDNYAIGLYSIHTRPDHT